ncbi:hypothetical protein BO99DRAFT_211141 [Aspergillus violaceofuscus CBS 115571]|uniref:Uncharacterized protein n=1 Tax=Aspergillus violaceofuscus (strain CBS 115571) TaxID=1450538 RepID=A0A2V5H4A9_ASPV1|nr:hypothetical protein BO99DRAFT_211141 [Aspergillus violaceofuscus CBS 115571]
MAMRPISSELYRRQERYSLQTYDWRAKSACSQTKNTDHVALSPMQCNFRTLGSAGLRRNQFSTLYHPGAPGSLFVRPVRAEGAETRIPRTTASGVILDQLAMYETIGVSSFSPIPDDSRVSAFWLSPHPASSLVGCYTMDVRPSGAWSPLNVLDILSL